MKSFHLECVRVMRQRSDRDVLLKWQDAGFKGDAFLAVLKTVSDCMDYPNWNFLPDDNLFQFVNDVDYEFSVAEILEDLSSKYPQLDNSAISVLNKHSKMIDFIRCICTNHGDGGIVR